MANEKVSGKPLCAETSRFVFFGFLCRVKRPYEWTGRRNGLLSVPLFSLCLLIDIRLDHRPSKPAAP